MLRYLKHINCVLDHDSALYGFTVPGTTWDNEMTFVMNHAPGAGSIARPVDQHASSPACYHCITDVPYIYTKHFRPAVCVHYIYYKYLLKCAVNIYVSHMRAFVDKAFQGFSSCKHSNVFASYTQRFICITSMV